MLESVQRIERNRSTTREQRRERALYTEVGVDEGMKSIYTPHAEVEGQRGKDLEYGSVGQLATSALRVAPDEQVVDAWKRAGHV
jgi:hypothetical protein